MSEIRKKNTEDYKPPTFWQALRASEFWLFLAGATSAMFGVRWWIVIR